MDFTDVSAADKETALGGWGDNYVLSDEIHRRATLLHQRGVPQTVGEGLLQQAMANLPKQAIPQTMDPLEFIGICNYRWQTNKIEEEPFHDPCALLQIPGFVAKVMSHTLTTAPYPNHALAFAGALALQSFLCARKVRTEGGIYPSLYLIALAMSGSGKDWPRRINMRILQEVGLANYIGESFASGEGIEDALTVTPAMLFQLDEMDGMLSAVKGDKDARFQGIMTSLLKIFTSSGSIMIARKKAAVKGQPTESVNILNPGLTLFGTAVPTMYYGALSEKMLTNGFFSRSIIIEGGKRSPGQDASMRDIPQDVIEIARYWSAFGHDGSELGKMNPVTKEITATPQAKKILRTLRGEMDNRYAACEEKQDNIGATLWSRVAEQASKLALIYACSVNHLSPVIDEAAMTWATQFAQSQASKMLESAKGKVSDTPFHAICLKMHGKISKSVNPIARNKLLREMHLSAKQFDEAIEYLVESNEIEVSMPDASVGRPGKAYKMKKAVV